MDELLAMANHGTPRHRITPELVAALFRLRFAVQPPARAMGFHAPKPGRSELMACASMLQSASDSVIRVWRPNMPAGLPVTAP